MQPDSRLKVASDFREKRIATPQLGNTQDVAARAWLAAGGLRITQTGGEAHVVPTSNPDQLVLFKQKQLDAVWTVETWVSRLEMEAQAPVLLEEPDAITTVLVTSVKFLGAKRQRLRTFVTAHQELTEWIKANSVEAQRMVREELAAETRTNVPAELVERAWGRIVVTSGRVSARRARSLGPHREAMTLRAASGWSCSRSRRCSPGSPCSAMSCSASSSAMTSTMPSVGA